MTLLLKSMKVLKNENSGVPGVADFMIPESFPALTLNSCPNSPTTSLTQNNEKKKNSVGNSNRNGNKNKNENKNEKRNDFFLSSTVSTRTNTMTMSSVSTCEYDLLYTPHNRNERRNENKYIDSCNLESTRSTVLQSFEENLRKEMETENLRQWRSDYIKNKHIDIKNKGDYECKQILPNF